MSAARVQARTLEFSKRTPIEMSTFSLIVVAGTIAGVFLICLVVMCVTIR